MNIRFGHMICVGLLSVAASAPADIIWSGEQNLPAYEQYIDLNSDSLTDVIIVQGILADNSIPSTVFGGYINAHVHGTGLDRANRMLVSSSDNYTAALPAGILISDDPDPSLQWAGGVFFTGRVSEWSTLPPDPDEEWKGLLGEDGNTYIGIEFEAAESTHYGWINIALGPEEANGFKEPIVTSWAYESTPDAAITAGAIPEPSTGVLALVGAAALLLARRRFR